MTKSIVIALFCVIFISELSAQNEIQKPDKLKVYIDCSNTWCDMTFIRSEINIVNFLLDNQAADVHLLITEQRTGGGGIKYQLIFFGQNKYSKQIDTLTANVDANATDFERRDLLIKYIKLGLVPYVSKTEAAKDVIISFKTDDKLSKSEIDLKNIIDPWNYWVFRIGAYGNLSADEVYKSFSMNANFSASRVTEDSKIGFEFNAGKNQNSFKLDDGNGNEEKIKIKNNDFNFEQFLVKSISSHWSIAYEIGLSRNTFSNNKSRKLFRTGIEYAIFPYKEVNTKFFTISYILDTRRNNYFDTTLYNKTKETLFGQSITAKLAFNQKWGTISFETNYHNYFHDWDFFNLGFNTNVNIRITGGLSFNINTNAALTRDQLFLPKGGATTQEVLTRRRQLASGYSFYTFLGINYRFGSKLNNFVNPRFE